MHKKLLILLIVLSLALTAAAQDAKWKYDNSTISEVSEDTVVAEGRTLSLDKATLTNEYPIDLSEIQNGWKIVIKGKWNDDKSVCDARSARVIAYDTKKYRVKLGSWGGIGTVLIQDGKIYAEFDDNVAHEIQLKGDLKAETQIKKEDLKPGMKIQYKFKETKAPFPTSDITVIDQKIEKNKEQTKTTENTENENKNDSNNIPDIKIQEINNSAE